MTEPAESVDHRAKAEELLALAEFAPPNSGDFYSLTRRAKLHIALFTASSGANEQANDLTTARAARDQLAENYVRQGGALNELREAVLEFLATQKGRDISDLDTARAVARLRELTGA